MYAYMCVYINVYAMIMIIIIVSSSSIIISSSSSNTFTNMYTYVYMYTCNITMYACVYLRRPESETKTKR